jgi:predicted RNA-binding Zn-ribbon protein involved in translation (DUF1610 family)
VTTDTERKLGDALRDIEVLIRDYALVSPREMRMRETLCQIERITSEATYDGHTCPICGHHHIVRDGQPPICVHCECAEIDRRAGEKTTKGT